MTVKELAQLWDIVEHHQLCLLPPLRKEGMWVARTNGGEHDKRPMIGSGKSAIQAIADVKPLEEQK